MKLYEVIKLNEARSPHIQPGVTPFGNQWALFLDDLDAPYYVFDNESTAMQAMDDFTDPNNNASAVRRQYRANQREIQSGFRRYLRPRENVTIDDLRAQAARGGDRGFLRTFLSGNRETLFRLLSAAGITASAFFGVAAAIADVEQDPTLSPEEKAELTDILRGQLLIQLIITLRLIFRSSTLLRRAWPIVVIVLGLWGAVRESKNNNKQQLNEAVPLIGLAWGAIQTAGGFLLRAAASNAARTAAGAAAARTAGTAATRTAATRASAAVGRRLTGANAIQFLRTAGVEVAVAIILSNPSLQRMLAEGIAGWALAGDIIEAIGNGVEGLVVVADETTGGLINRFFRFDGNDTVVDWDKANYVASAEWAKLIFKGILFGKNEKQQVPYINPEQRKLLLTERINEMFNITEPAGGQTADQAATPIQPGGARPTVGEPGALPAASPEERRDAAAFGTAQRAASWRTREQSLISDYSNPSVDRNQPVAGPR